MLRLFAVTLFAAASPDFSREVAPLLERACVGCHGPTKQRGRLRLDTRAAMLAGGEGGPALVPGNSAASALVKAVSRQDPDMAMPPDDEQALTTAEVNVLRAWIDAGAAFPAGATLQEPRQEASAIDAATVAALPPPASRPVDFVRDVQPLFARACLGCHGPTRQESSLRLDHKATLMRGGDLGAAVVPGRSAESPLIHFVAGLRREGVMPAKGERLTREEIGLLRAWIDQGADFPDHASVTLKDPRAHWAWKPVTRPAPPPVKTPGWVRNPIDAFVLARLEREGLPPSPQAPRATLMRRLYLDLTGLPPTAAEAQAFLQDTAPDAPDRLVERLLASPHYGERWGRHWLDAARYADTDGFEKDKTRFIWFYRDWVVSAFNRDLPYDRFITEQIAGDLLPGAGQDTRVATGFLRNSMINEEGGADPEQFRVEALFDRVDALGKAVLGITVGCAQCHSHKFDPLSHKEYYRLFAFLNNDHEASPAVYTAPQERQRQALLQQINAAELSIMRAHPDWRARMARWEESLARPRVWTPLQAPFEDESTGGARYLMQPDGAYLVQGFAPARQSSKVHFRVDKPVGALRLELLTDPNLPMNGPGRSIKGTVALSELVLEAAPADKPDEKQPVKLVHARADFGQAEAPLDPLFPDEPSGEKKRTVGPVGFATDGHDETAWGIDAGPGRRNQAREAVFTLATPIHHAGGTRLTVTLKQQHGGWNSDDNHTHGLGRFRLSFAETTAAPAEVVPPAIRSLLAIPRARRTGAQERTIFSHFRSTVAAWHKDNERIEALWRQHPEPTSTLVLQARESPRQTHVFMRGDWQKPGPQVSPGVPAFLNPWPEGAPLDRRGLARWLVDRRAPTTARAFVNRIWQGYFGTGLAATSEDLGTQSEPPSHPELLDWLAAQLMESGWRVKDLHRLIVRSATYRQSSVTSPALLERDPANRLLARGARFRVEAEVVRDVFLAASGLLDRSVGGAGVMPPAPAFLFLPPVSYGPFPWIEAQGPARYRRAVYTFRRRSTPYPMLQTFDAPSGDAACLRRGRSNTPLQALITLNETVSMEAAQALARRMWESDGTTDEARLNHGFWRVLGRGATSVEARSLLDLLARQRKRLAEGWLDPWRLATSSGERPAALPHGATPSDLAAYTLVARVILNLDEAITKE